ncbi:hypothetical protein PR202_gb19527 [Eleusine coracana subsp. coracana]|uniref:DUF1618 domain-containing protein n=1 Tax=Eleusine coracana subsp. coracana TaxID=191504 RepID=A0AAV5F6A0_ELECO|nr:hypothetical protein PR202_gb19527 [Eleusine coracana subsp. coracana]
MPDPVAAMSLLSCSPAWVLLDEFAILDKRRNHTTATGLTSFKRPVRVSFELAHPPEASRWFVHCPGLKKKRGLNGHPQILNAAESLVVLRMQFLRGGDVIYDYFVYRAGPGKPSLDLIPGPCPTVAFPKQVGILPRGDLEEYSVIFPRCKPRRVYEIRVFSSENNEWRTKVARISTDPETTYHEVAMHLPSKAIVAGVSSLAWIDLWRGVLLCEHLDTDAPTLRLIKWPVPSPQNDLLDIYSGHGSRDATLSNGVIRFLEQKFHEEGGASSRDVMGYCWIATTWKRAINSTNWSRVFKADIVNILATDSRYSDLLQKTLWNNELNKLDLNKLSSAPPTLSLNNENVLYFTAKLETGGALLLAVNTGAGMERLETFIQTSCGLSCAPCSFSRFLDASPGDLFAFCC